jgi:hypothetical protein
MFQSYYHHHPAACSLTIDLKFCLAMSSLLSLAGEGGRRPDEGGSKLHFEINFIKPPYLFIKTLSFQTYYLIF